MVPPPNLGAPKERKKKLSGDLAWGIPREMEVAVAQVVWTRALI